MYENIRIYYGDCLRPSVRQEYTKPSTRDSIGFLFLCQYGNQQPDSDAKNAAVDLQGYSAIAIVRFDSSMPDQFHLFTPRVLPECVRSALLKKSERLVNDAFSVSAREFN
jgi:hypothetical protein